MLEHAFQAILGASFAPGDGQLWSLYLPRGIRKITVNPHICERRQAGAIVGPIAFDAWMTEGSSDEIFGDVDFSVQDDVFIQFEGVGLKNLAQATARDDTLMFTESVWLVSAPSGESASMEAASSTEKKLAESVERIGCYYWRQLEDTITAFEWTACQEQHKRLHSAIAHYFAKPQNSSFIEPEWQQDDETIIRGLVDKFGTSCVDIRLANSVGRALPSVVRGESTMIEHMRVDNMLDDFYVDGLGFAAANRSLARMMRQITHRFPKTDILEIGAGTGSATKAIFDSIQGSYASYTYTDISSGFFENAAEKFADHSSKMSFQTLDIEKPPSQQGYSKLYDVIIASNVLHATQYLHKTLTHVRSLLKPGGYLLLLEITDNTSIRFSFLMGGLSGWWLGANDNRTYSPCVSPLQWNQALRKAGFAGIDTITHADDKHTNPMSIIAAQAVDEKVQILRRPLLKARETHACLYVLGGDSLLSSNLIDEVLANIEHRFGTVINIPVVEDASQQDIPPHATIISFLDLDGPIWKDLTSDKLRSLQHVFTNAHNLFWVSHGQRERPWVNASAGFLRSLAAEQPTLRVQTLDFDSNEKPQRQTSLICEVFLRFLETEKWEQDPNFWREFLWTTEPELQFKSGELLVKRVQWHNDNNDRLNSSRRNIEKQVDEGVALHLSSTGARWSIYEDYTPNSLPSDDKQARVEVEVSHSTLRKVQINDNGSGYLVIGRRVLDHRWILAVTSERSSRLKIIPSQVLEPSHAVERPADLLAAVLSEIISDRIERLVGQQSGTVLILEPAELLAATIVSSESSKLSCVRFLTCDTTKLGKRWLHIHHHDSQRAIRNLMPQDTLALMHFEEQHDIGFVNKIASCLPPGTKVVSPDWLFSGFPRSASSPAKLDTLTELTSSLARAEARLRKESSLADVAPMRTNQINLAQLQHLPRDTGGLFTIIDWSDRTALTAHVRPIRPETIFRQDRSYILVGMTGETGRSVCQWMVRSGAGAVVLASRNPRIERTWIDEVESSGSIGAKIKVTALDATSRSAWVDFVAELKRELPPVAGMLNGAMVLQDVNFEDMGVDDFNRAVAAKIDGTIYMDEFFRDAQLDFFIVFSSFASQIGSRGQTNYNAANAFMAAVVQQRRKRGLAASALHLGSLMGIGLLNRDMGVRSLVFDKFGYTPISEPNLHHIIAQLIISGLPDSRENPDIITGIRKIIEGEEKGLHWATNPIFSHLVVRPEQKSDAPQKRSIVAARTQLAAVTTKEEAVRVLTICFGAKLIAMLQIAEASFRTDASLVGLGVDSLVAIDIRSWFLKEVGVNIVVLKILGGMSTADLAEYAVTQMSEELLPGLGSNPTTLSTEASNPEAPISTPNSPPLASSLESRTPHWTFSKTASIVTPSTPSDSSSTPSNADSSSDLSSVPLMPGTQGLPSSHNDSEAPKILRRVEISPAQSRFWFLNMFLEDPTSSNITLSFNIQGRVRVPEFRDAVMATSEAHEILRSCFLADNESSQRVWLGLMEGSRVDFRHDNINSDKEIKDVYDRVRKTRYDLREGKTLQVRLLSKTLTDHTIIFGYHHIVLDGMGFEAFKRDLERCYKGQTPYPQGHGFYKAAEEQTKSLADGTLQQRFEYWRKEFQMVPAPLPLLPVSKANSRAEMNAYKGSYAEQRLESTLSKDVKSVCRQHQVTPSHFYLAVFRALLFRLTYGDRLCVGVADANRHDDNVTSTVGLFLNILPLHFTQSAQTKFCDLLRETRTKFYEGLGNAGVPFDELLKVLNVPRSSSYSPLFQCFYDYHSGTEEKFEFHDQSWSLSNRNPGERAYDITLDVIEGGAGTLISFIGQDYLYGEREINKLLKCYLTLLEHFVKHPSTVLESGPLYDMEEIEIVSQLGRGPELKFEWPATLGHRVYDICRAYPDSIAIKSGPNQEMTYSELESRALSIQHQLLQSGIKTGDRVAIFQDPGADWICSLIALFWIGAVYVPMVPQQPQARLNAVLKESRPKVILTHVHTVRLASSLTSEAEIIDVSQQDKGTQSRSPSINADAESPAVILFTSGSTGVPKGIVLRHRNLINHVEGYVKSWSIGREVVLQQSAYSFDLSIGQIFTALGMGGALVVAPQDKRGDPLAIAQLICTEGITWTLLTPSEYASILQHGSVELRAAPSWRHALACGETLSSDLVSNFAELNHKGVRLYNCYGPAEAIVSATMIEIEYRTLKSGDVIPIGRPNANYSIYIVDDHTHVVPQGFMGEILIGGCGVGLGYLNLQELNHEKFLKWESLSEMEKLHGWQTVYRTGDVGRFDKDGNLLYGGRLAGDGQVKIRGFRVELQDIEATLMQSSNGVISEAVVTLRSNPDILVAHVILSQKQMEENVSGFLTGLLSNLPLPNYMRPARAIVVDTLPRNLHGKTDRSAVKSLLLPPEVSSVGNEITETPTQEQLVQIWRNLLPAELVDNLTIGSSTEFFAVGGNSLLLVRVQAEIRAVFDVSVRLVDLLNVSSLGQMASLIESSRVIEEIDWDKETAIGDVLDLVGTTIEGQEPKSSDKTVLLTGATGFFGGYLLRELVSDPSVSRVHCLAVRAETVETARARIPHNTSSKVHVHLGDLSAPRLGLSQKIFAALSDEADVIILSGGKRSFWDNFYELRATNFESVRELVRLAVPRKVPMQYLSTRGVLLLNDAIDPQTEGSVTACPPPTDGSNGYAASKWAGEALLEKASQSAGIPVTIHRFTERSDRGSEEARQAALKDILGPTLALRQLPERSTWAGRFDGIECAPLAREIITSGESSAVRFMHHQGSFYLTPSELFDYLDKHLGDVVHERVNFLPWVGAIKRMGYKWLFTAHDISLTKTEDGKTTTLHERR